MKTFEEWGALSVGVALLSSCSMANAAAGKATAETESIRFSGDLRLRYEVIHQAGAADRERARYRGRFAVELNPVENIRVELGLATGGNNPVSNNQTFGEGFTSKDIGLNLLSVHWNINDQYSLTGGKMKLPWFRAGKTVVAWDSDLRPEGLVLVYKSDVLFASGGAFLVEERATDSNTTLYYGQAGIKIKLNEASAITAGGGYFGYSDTVGVEPFFQARPNGNTVDANGRYVNNFRDVELFAQYDTALDVWPLTLFVEWMKNNEVESGTTAWSYGGKIGKAKRQGSMELSYAYHDTGADAVIGTFSDSDVAGGRTDSTGHLIKGKFALRENLFLGFTLILSEFGEPSGIQTDYDRLMLDFEVKF